MQVQLLSDIHLDSLWRNGVKPTLEQKADYLVIAGDVHNGYSERAADWLSQHTEGFSEVLMVLGNHDYWGFHSMADTLVQWRGALKGSNITLLQNELDTLGELVVYGGTGWAAAGGVYKELSRDWCDFQHISLEGSVPFSLADMISENQSFKQEAAQLGEELCVDLVITHHLPHFDAVSPFYSDSPDNGFFNGDMIEVAKNLNARHWMFGHTHEYVDVNIEGVRCTSHPHGYYLENTRKSKLRSRVFEIPLGC